MKLMSAREILDELEVIFNKLNELDQYNGYTRYHAMMDIHSILEQNKRKV